MEWLSNAPKSEHANAVKIMSLPNTDESPINWFIHLNGEEKGPFSTSEVRSQIRSGGVDETTLIWQEGWEGWKTLASIPELAEMPPAAALASKAHEVIGTFKLWCMEMVRSIVQDVNSAKKEGWLRHDQGTSSDVKRVPSDDGSGVDCSNYEVTSSTPWTALSPPAKRLLVKFAVVGCSLLMVMFLLSSGDESNEVGKTDPEAYFAATARGAQDEMRRNDGKPCRVCNGAGHGKLGRCRSCYGQGTVTTPSGYAMVCSQCGGRGLVPDTCGACGGTGVFRSPY